VAPPPPGASAFDPSLEAMQVFDYTEAALREAGEVVKFNPEDVSYKPKLDPFPRPTRDVVRYDVRPAVFPRAGGSLNQVMPDVRNFRKMAIYVRGGIVEAVRFGRVAYQRILTYTLRSLTAKINQMLFLTAGLLLTGHAVLTPMLMVLLMISGDFLAMSAATDHVRASSQPNAWRIGRVTVTAAVLGICNALFCTSMLELAAVHFGLTQEHGLRTFAAVTLVFSTQAAFYVVRGRRSLWSSRPSGWVILSSLVDLAIICVLAGQGILIHALACA